MSSFHSLKNIKELLNEIHTKEVYHDMSGFTLTAQTMSLDGYEKVTDILSPNPFKEDFRILNKIEEELEIDTIYLAYGVREFKGNIELAASYMRKEGYGASNEKILKEIKELNPPIDEKVKDIVLILAFSHIELRLIRSAIDAGAKKDLAIYVSEISEVIEALHYCDELFKAFENINNVSQNYNIPIEHASLVMAKAIFEERGFSLPDVLKTAELPEAKKQAPQININVEE